MSDVPQNAHITTSICFHEMLKALDFHADHFPVERLTLQEVRRVAAACGRMAGRLNAHNDAKSKMLDEWVKYQRERALDREG